MRLSVGNTHIDISIEEIKELNSMQASQSPVMKTIIKIFDKVLEIVTLSTKQS